MEHSENPTKLTPEQLRCKKSEKFHILRRVAIESIWGLMENCEVRVLEACEVLLEKGQANRIMYMVLSGQLSVSLEGAQSPPVAHLEEGQTVGELSVIDGSAASAWVRADGPTRLLCVNEPTFWRLVRASHEFSTNLLLLLAQRMRTNNFSLAESARLQRQFEKDAMTDGLTGLYNRRWLDDRLPRLVERTRRDGMSLCVFMVDVDFFKNYNDTYGHAAGDIALAAVARGIAQNLRPLDIAVRYGGEEFSVILPGTPLEGAGIAAGRLVSSIEKMPIDGNEGQKLPRVTISVGVSSFHPDDDASSMLRRADEALYRAKQNGRNRFETQ